MNKQEYEQIKKVCGNDFEYRDIPAYIVKRENLTEDEWNEMKADKSIFEGLNFAYNQTFKEIYGDK